MNNKQQPLFFGWDSPWLPRLATYLLTEWSEGGSSPREDLSKTIVIVPGRRAGRRLLELLALQAEEEKISLIPPRMVTLREAVALLLVPQEKYFPEAGEWMCRLAWHEAFQKLPQHLLQKIQPLPQEVCLNKAGERQEVSGLVNLAEGLAQELGSVGLSFSNVAARVESLFPESAEREEPRWQALAEAQQSYRSLLASWGYSDPDDALHLCLEQGIVQDSWRVLVVGIVDSSPLFNSFFEKVKPKIIILAPEKHAAGFSKQGKLVTAYWLEHPVSVEDAQLISCERSEHQAAEVVRLVSDLKDPCGLAAVAVPDVTTLPLLQDRLEHAGLQTHWAGGLSFRGGRLHQLLQALADFFDHKEFPGPSFPSVGALVRHPDIQPHCSAPEEFLIRLDALEREHLPAFLDKESLSLFKKNTELLFWIEGLEQLVGTSSHPLSLNEGAASLRSLLLRILGKRQVRSDDLEGHYFLGCLEQCLLMLEEIEKMPLQASLFFLKTDFIKKLLDLLTQKNIPEREEPGALELLGWLEIAADDAPCAIITSCHEGFLPRSQLSHPLLPQGLRKNLGLPDEAMLLACDHYLLHNIVASRQTIILAPRYNGRGEPVRPSRLLMLGVPPEKLPERVLILTQRSSRHQEEGEKKEEISQHSSHFHARPVGEEIVTTVTVTGLRTYLQSPRLFYLQHVLKLREMEESPLEMHAGHFGTMIHAVLGAFGMEKKIAQETDAQKIAAWLRKKLFSMAHRYFAPGPTFPITLQLEEAAQTLDGFAVAQAAHQRDGWQILASENSEQHQSRPLEKKIILRDGRSMLLQGRIDRVDWHPQQERWMIIDYKTLHRQDWKNATPDKEHFQKKGEEIIWKDLQLPLYLKLAPHWEPLQKSGLPLPTVDNTDLCYFQLPIESAKAGWSEPFHQAMIVPAWHEANRLIAEILDSNFDTIGEIDAGRMPTLAALCGITMLQ